MNANQMSDRTTRNLRIAGWTLAIALLALPAVAMQFTNEVNWTASDFIFAGVVFAVVGGLFELAARASANIAYRAAVVVAVAAALMSSSASCSATLRASSPLVCAASCSCPSALLYSARALVGSICKMVACTATACP